MRIVSPETIYQTVYHRISPIGDLLAFESTPSFTVAASAPSSSSSFSSSSSCISAVPPALASASPFSATSPTRFCSASAPCSPTHFLYAAPIIHKIKAVQFSHLLEPRKMGSASSSMNNTHQSSFAGSQCHYQQQQQQQQRKQVGGFIAVPPNAATASCCSNSSGSGSGAECKRRHSLPKAHHHRVTAASAAKFAAAHKTSSASAHPPSPPSSVHSANQQHMQAKQTFDPAQNIDLSFLETVPTFDAGRARVCSADSDAAAAQAPRVPRRADASSPASLPSSSASVSPAMLDGRRSSSSSSSSSGSPQSACAVALPAKELQLLSPEMQEREAAARRKRKSKAVVVRPSFEYRSILKHYSKYGSSSPTLPEKQQLPTPPSRSPTKTFRFNEQVLVGETWPREEYERKSDFMLHLTPDKAYRIKKELNDFKRDEMPVHEESRRFTHFFN